MNTSLSILPKESFVLEAFAELVADTRNLLDAARAARPCDREEVSFWSKQHNAVTRAEYHWRSGVRPQTSDDGAWLIPSASRGGSLIHRLTYHGGVLICSCEAGVKGLLCWHHQLACVITRGAELETIAEDEAELRLATKISVARARAMQAMDPIRPPVVLVLHENEPAPI